MINMNIDALCSDFPLYSEDLGIELKKPSGRFRWFLASILFGARISEKIAMKTYKTFEKYGILSPDKIINAGWDELVRILDEGGYVRYDFSTATKLMNIMKELKEKYGSLEKLYANSRNTEELKSKLMEFKGIGEVTAQIFLRELRGVWKIDVPVSSKAAEMAERMNINLEEFEGEKLTRVEDALVKLYLRYGKKGKHRDTMPQDIVAVMKS
jgi:endonuclease III